MSAVSEAMGSPVEGSDSPAGQPPGPDRGALGPWARIPWIFGAWAALVAAGPGALWTDGSPWLGVVALGIWAHAAARPGRFALWIEWAAGALGLGTTMFWIHYVSPAALPPAAIGMGLYPALAGWALRRLVGGARLRLPLVVAAPIAWVTFELLRDLLEPPFGMGWLRAGHLAAAHGFWLAGARVVGVEGLSFSMVALGVGAGLALRKRRPLELLPGALTFALVCGLGWLVGPPELAPGPRVLLIQPNFSVYEKQGRLNRNQRLAVKMQLTRAGLDEAGEVDLVCWPETSLPTQLLGPGTLEDIAAGAGFQPWADAGFEPSQLGVLEGLEQRLIEDRILGELPDNTAFLGGGEEWVTADGVLRRRNVLALWQREEQGEAGGEPRRQLGAKVKLAPFGETVFGLERFGWIRNWIAQAAGYLPDFLPGEASSVLVLRGADRSPLRLGATVCFDNAYQGPYLDTIRREPVDLFMMVSNEAWYLRSWEMDQMVAFSKVLAVVSGRSLVRCTNSGVTTVLDPLGRRVDSLRVGGSDREVAGHLAVTVPVPLDRDLPPPPYARWIAPWRWALVGLGLGLAWLAGRSR